MSYRGQGADGADYCCVFTKLNQEQLQSERKSAGQVHIISRTDSSSRFANLVDIKGAATLAVTITFFLLALTYLENISNPSNLIPLISFSVVSVVSLLFFIRIERKMSVVTTSAKTTSTTTSPSPLVNLNLMIHKILLPTNINLMIISITMFMVYQSIPILVRSPKP
ncbi:MAG: hypothetical protein WA421_01515, partial [Nitrososphaeraceae archaeon]